jgi:2-polyprenyl-3-methyl-5-hydroxy-6-metoxy-1,4-benzoquinol methylase
MTTSATPPSAYPTPNHGATGPDPRLRRHELGFLEVVDKPSPEVLAAYYAHTYYQTEASSYRKSYSPLETEVIQLRVAQRASQIATLRGHSSPGSLLDVGCGEGFVIGHFHALGWKVAGIDFSRAGVEWMNPHCTPFVHQGDVFQLLHDRIAAGERHDLVWLGNVLEHVLDPVGLLRQLRQIIAINGLLVVTVPNDGHAYHEELFASGDIARRFWIAIPDHMSYFTGDSLRRTVSATSWNCLALQGDFPIDLYLAHAGSNYIADPAQGTHAHAARLRLERLIGQAGHEAANHFYASLAAVGLGRNITAYLRPSHTHTPT